MSEIAKNIIKKYSKAKIVKTEEVNTLNAWGFGGWYGKKIIYSNGYYINDGRWKGRHTGASAYVEYYDYDGCQLTHEQFEADIENNVTKILYAEMQHYSHGFIRCYFGDNGYKIYRVLSGVNEKDISEEEAKKLWSESNQTDVESDPVRKKYHEKYPEFKFDQQYNEMKQMLSQ